MFSLLAIPAWAWVTSALILVAAAAIIAVLLTWDKIRAWIKSKGGGGPAAKTTAANTAKTSGKVYHITKRKEDGKWQIKAEGAEKAIKLFKTQKEAIEYCKTLAGNQDASIMVHKEDGSFRKV